MKKWNFTLGVDVSKLTMDIHCREMNIHIQVLNGSQGFRAFQSWCKECKIDLKSSVIAMEYTGGYEYKFIQYCESNQIHKNTRICNKEFFRIMRGKNDKVDASRIAQYADEKHVSMEAAGPINTTIIELRQLLLQRVFF